MRSTPTRCPSDRQNARTADRTLPLALHEGARLGAARSVPPWRLGLPPVDGAWKGVENCLVPFLKRHVGDIDSHVRERIAGMIQRYKLENTFSLV